MAAEWLLSAVIIVIATPAFGHFEMVRHLDPHRPVVG
jgi:hypothetical protein